MPEKINYNGWPNCIRLSNDEIELIVTTDVGPRIMRFGFINGQNLLYPVPEHAGKTGGEEWRIYGGHRLWLAPEALPFSYNPDNDEVEFELQDKHIKLIQAKEAITGIVKEIEITLSPDKNEVKVLHRLINQNLREVELAAWAITMLAPGGRAIIPQEPYGEGDDYLLPSRSLALWQYTKMNDPRWIWGEKYIQVKQDPLFTSEQKIGVTNKQGWIAYCLKGEVLIKKFDFDPAVVYPDYNCNNETYISANYLEIETLGPLTKLAPGGMVEHTEHWLLAKATADETDKSIDTNILPIVSSFQMKMIISIVSAFIFWCFLPYGAISQPKNAGAAVSLQFDGAKRLQQIDGIGVNVNTRSWNGKELEPALELLLDSMHATIWRVIVETVEKWEEVNDNSDPFTFNWDYYNKLYGTPKFQKAWDMIQYLNERGITDKLMVNFMGFAPEWMGVKVIQPKYEDEYVEMILSFYYYAIKTRHLKFGLIAPTNESDHHKYSEGPHLNGKQHARIIQKLIVRMDALGLGDIRIVAPDNAGMESSLNEFVPALMADSIVMLRMAHFGFHSYNGYYPGLKEYLLKSPYPKSSFWITEWNAWCNGCDDGILGEYNYDYARKSVYFLLDILKNGASAALAWEGYDSYYEHHAPSLFSYWGLLAYDAETRTYHPRKTFYTIAQVSKFVPPDSWQISVSANPGSLMVLSFYDSASNRITIVGINNKNHPVTLNGSLKNLPAISSFEMYYTDSVQNLHKNDDVAVYDNAFTATVPSNSVYTLTGLGKKNDVAENAMKPEPAN